MKTLKLVSVLTILFLTISVPNLSAQDENQNNLKDKKERKGDFHQISNLSEDQKTKIKEIKTSHQKEIMPIRNEIREKEAHLQTLMTKDIVDLNEIYKLIDEISIKKTIIAKKRAENIQNIRKLLTPEQKVEFDLKQCKRKNRHNED